MKLQTHLLLAAIEKRLNDSIRLSDSYSKPLLDTMRYALLGPGKRLRPILVLLSFAALQPDCKNWEDILALALDPACSIEMIHAYSLVHDDLPAMDDDDLRRGRKTAHKAFSEALAILAGDALQTLAFETLANAKKIDSDVKVKLMRRLAIRCGKDGMAEGQAIDILSKSTAISEDILISMQRKKTGDLFSCCFEFGAILAGREDCLDAMRSIGLSLGLAYQVRDDLVDREQAGSSSVFILGEPQAKKVLADALLKIEKEILSLSNRGNLIHSFISPLFF